MSVLGNVSSSTPQPAELQSNTSRLDSLQTSSNAADLADTLVAPGAPNYTDPNPPGPGPYVVRLDWRDAYGNGVSQRYGKQGSFGWRHHYYDHNMSTNIARQVTQRSDSRNTFISGQKYEWRNIVRRYRCSPYSCSLIDHRDLLVSVDYRLLSDHKNFGVVTGFCVGDTFCPDWVNNGN